MRIKLNGLLVCVILLMIGSNICFAKQRKAVPADIFVDKDVEVKYKDVKLQKTDWGYVVRYSRVKENEWAYILTKLPEKYDRFSVRFKCRVYPVDPDTRNMYRVTNAYVISAFKKLKQWTSVNGIYNLPNVTFLSMLDFGNVLNFPVCQSLFYATEIHKKDYPEKLKSTNFFNNLSFDGISCFYRVYDIIYSEKQFSRSVKKGFRK
jgi:hypothetical protein